jgi:tetratricopeptide (TPR) repeat protein
MERRDYVAAIDLLSRSNEVFPHFKTLELLGECLLESRKDGTEAVTVLAAAAGLGNRASRAYYLLARALHGCGRTQEAIEKLDAAIGFQCDFRAASEFRDELLRTPGNDS